MPVLHHDQIHIRIGVLGHPPEIHDAGMSIEIPERLPKGAQLVLRKVVFLEN